MIGWTFIFAGAFCAIFALYVELRHKSIWERSTHSYRRSTSILVHTLIRPSKISYRVNVFFIWPIVFALGVWSVMMGISLIQAQV